MAVKFEETKVGDKLRIVGQGAPGFARINDIVTVTACDGVRRIDVVNEAGESAYFALSCGAERLQRMEGGT